MYETKNIRILHVNVDLPYNFLNSMIIFYIHICIVYICGFHEFSCENSQYKYVSLVVCRRYNISLLVLKVTLALESHVLKNTLTQK